VPALSTVTLRRDQPPNFPPRCAFSGLPHDGETVLVVSRDGSRGKALWAGWYAVRVPCRHDLKIGVYLSQGWRFCRTVVVGLGTMALAAWLIYPRLKDALLGLAAFVCTLISLALLVWWERAHPPPFQVSPHLATVDFEFMDVEYAREFARLNFVPTATDE